MTPARATGWLTLALATSVVAAFTGTAWLVATPSGISWATHLAERTIPALSISSIRGSLAGGTVITRAAWHSVDGDVELEQLRLRLKWRDLLRGHITLCHLHVNKISITINSGKPATTRSTNLPVIAIPLAIGAENLSVDEIDVRGFRVTGVRSNLAWSGTTLRATGTRADVGNVHITGRARLTFDRQYPLTATISISSPALPVPVTAKASGDLQRLVVTAAAGGGWPLTAHTKIAALSQPLTVDVTLRQTGPLQWPAASSTVQLNDAVLHASGTPEDLHGQFSTRLQLPGIGTATLAGAIAWRQPGLTVGKWQLDLPTGAVQGSCSATLTATAKGHCDGHIKDVALAPWLPVASGSLSSRFQIGGSLQDGRLQLTAALPNITGHLNGTDIRGTVTADTTDAQLWHLRHLALAIGKNHLTASGNFGGRSHLSVSVSAPDLGQLSPLLDGTLAGRATLTGAWPALQVEGSLEGTALRWRQWHSSALNVGVNLAADDHRQSHMTLALSQLSAGRGPTLSLDATAHGDHRVQNIAATITDRSTTVLTVQCRQVLPPGARQGSFRCSQLYGQLPAVSPGVEWRQRTPLQGTWALDHGEARIQPTCLATDDAELCWRQPVHYSDGKLQPVTVIASAIPLQWWRRYLPIGLVLQGDPRAGLRVDIGGLQPPAIDADLRVGRVQWQWPGHPDQLAGLESLSIHAVLAADKARFSASANSPELGSLRGDLTVSEPAGAGGLAGTVRIAGLKLSGFAWAIKGLDTVAGTTDANIAIGGHLDAPTLNGRLMLTAGRLRWGPMHEPAENIHLDTRFDQHHLSFNGGFNASGGSGTVNGNLDWRALPSHWQLQATVSADQLLLTPLPDSTVTTSGKLSVNARPQTLKINGSVRIGKADITLQQLPPESVGVSPDAKIVGRKPQPSSWQLQADVGLDLGDKFHFSGFGADADLYGKLQIDQNSGQPLKVTGEVKIPKGRYQAYGQRLSVRQGSFVFAGPWDNPNIQLEAVRDLPPTATTVVGLQVSGPLSDPKATLFSEPPMPETDIAYYFLTGKPPAQIGQAAHASASSTLLSLGVAGGGGQAARLAEKFGITDFRIGTVQTEAGAEAEVSGYVTPKLFIRYGSGINRASGEFTFQYQLTPKLAIEAVSGLQQSLDLLYSFTVK